MSLPGWDKPLGLLSQRHDVLAIRLTDPLEYELPDLGPIVLEDSETGEQLYVDTHDGQFRHRFQQAGLQREQELAQIFKRCKVDSLSLATDEDLVRAIVRFAKSRQRIRR